MAKKKRERTFHLLDEKMRALIASDMSAFGPKRTLASALQMSAFGGKADMTVCGNSLSRRYWGQSGRALLHCICPLMTQSGHFSLSGISGLFL
jgi:hypothetical protein